MLKPTEEQINQALEEAESMREDGEDPCHLAKTTQYLYQRLNYLQNVFDAANKYVHFGQQEREHAELVRAIEAAKREEAKESEQEREDIGL